MSHKIRKRILAKPKARARVFAALGDKTRLALVAKLTRQAITKHLGVLEKAGIVRSSHAGRERLFEFDPEPLEGLKEYLNSVSKQWDQTLSRLKSYVEK